MRVFFTIVSTSPRYIRGMKQASPPKSLYSRETVEFELIRLQREQEQAVTSKRRTDAGRYSFISEDREASK